MSINRNDEMKNDILQVLPVDKYPFVLDLLKKDWPIYIHVHYWLENTMKWKKKDPSMLLDICYPKDQFDSGIFLGISRLGFDEIMIITIGENSQDLLLRIFMETKRFSWKPFFKIGGLHGNYISTINFVLNELKTLHFIPEDKNMITDFASINYKDADDCLKDDIIVPDDCYLSNITEHEIEYIHSQWPHKCIDQPKYSLDYLATLAKMNDSVGLYSKQNNELLSWVLQNQFGAVAIAHTADKHRNKGYAQIVIKTLIKKIAEETGHHGIAFIVDGNKISESLFAKMKFKRISSLSWISIE